MRDSAVWPTTWIGEWQAEDGKTVRLHRVDEAIVVTVAPGPSEAPYVSAELLGGGRMPIERLAADCRIDAHGFRCLQVEAGTRGVGPTYRLSAAVKAEPATHPAGERAEAASVVLLPNVGIGLYDDWGDDLGVPWAFPLLPLRWAGE